jgi:activator of HSP90 ATPase
VRKSIARLGFDVDQNMFLNIFSQRVPMYAHLDRRQCKETNESMPIMLTRRSAIAHVAGVLGALAASRRATAQQEPPEPTKEKPATGPNRLRTSIHQEINLPATPQHVFDVLLDAKQFAAFTGLPAEIDPRVGGTFKTFGGLIEGRNVEFISAQRIVQAWRPASWDAGLYSIVHFELKPSGAATLLTLDHTGFPEGLYDHLAFGWKTRYWEPLKKYLG